MENIYRVIGIIVFWFLIGSFSFMFMYLLLQLVWYKLGLKKLYAPINSWIWFYILRKTLPSANIRYGYKTYGYWKYAAKYRLRNIRKVSRNNNITKTY